MRLVALLLAAGCSPFNNPPSAPQVGIGPVRPATGDDLVAVILADSVDLEGDRVTYRYTWIQDGLPRTDLTSDTVPASETIKDELWQLIVTPTDGDLDGSSGSAQTTIVNTPPTPPGVAITPADAMRGDDLTCTVTTVSSDVDGDALTYSFEWDGNGETYDGATAGVLTSVVDGSNVGEEETWTCEVTANDGMDKSLAAHASTTTGACSTWWYADADKDGYGDPATATVACEQPSGHVLDGTDCNDEDASVHPDAEEVGFDGIDNDCDGEDCASGITFTSTSYVRSERETIGAKITDIDDDGYEDIIWVNQLSASLTLWWGGASGPAVAESTVSVGRVGANADAGDLNGDGYPDLIASAQDSSRFVILWGTGTRTFGSTSYVSQDGFPRWMWLVDADRDGDLDIVAILEHEECAVIRLNDGTGTFAEAGCWRSGKEDVRPGDLDGDGYDELIESNTGNVYSSASGTFTLSTELSIPDMGTNSFLHAYDVDLDGDIDVVEVNFSSEPYLLRTHRNDGTGSLSECDQLEAASGTHPWGIGDLDADGRFDYIYYTCASGYSTWYIGLMD